MIKLAILTPRNSYENIKKYLKDIECEIKYIFYDNLYDLESLYLKNAQEYDGIITSGPIGYEIIKNSVELFTPLYHFDISKGDLYKYLFNILKKNPKIDFSRVYIDFISPEKKEYWFQDVFKKEEEPIFYQINFSNKNLYETLKSNYINLKKESKIDMVLTRISNMVKFLKNEEISSDFLSIWVKVILFPVFKSNNAVLSGYCFLKSLILSIIVILHRLLFKVPL